MARRRIRRRSLRREQEELDPDADPVPSIDLHGLRPDAALARLAQAVHAARVRGEARLDVITGRGIGNPQQQPVLRTRVEAWLEGPEGRRFGVVRLRRIARGGCLRVEFGNPRDVRGER